METRKNVCKHKPFSSELCYFSSAHSRCENTGSRQLRDALGKKGKPCAERNCAERNCAERNNRQKDTHSTRLTMRTVEAEDRRDQRKKRGLEGLQHYSKTIFLQRNDHSFLTRQNKRWT